MPEVVTKHRDLLIKELKDAGGKCGVGAPQQILKKCPADHFCQLPTGEICAYDFKDISSMTQISMADWAETVTGVPGMFGMSNLLVMIFLFGIGMVIGMILNKKNKS